MSDELRNSLMNSSYYLNYLDDSTLRIINERLEAYASLKNIILPLHKSFKHHVALRIKAVGSRSSARLIAEICFPESDNRYGLQMDGRDLKRWAAIVLNEIFTEKAIIDRNYWHE